MSMNTNFDIGPLIICKPNGKKPFDAVDRTKERLWHVRSEGEKNIYDTYHVFAPNREGYTWKLEKWTSSILSIDAVLAPGFPVCIPGVDLIEDSRNNFVEDYRKDIDELVLYYGIDSVRIIFAVYVYTR